MRVVVTGGAGYIGAHACKALLKAGHEVVSLDNCFRGHAAAMDRLMPMAAGRLSFIKGDICDGLLMQRALRERSPDAVLHFAALAYVGESVDDPLTYYRNNVQGMITLLEACKAAGTPRFVFSSSCSTYGQPPADKIPVPEDCPQEPMSPYGYTKLVGEKLLAHFAEGQRRAGIPFGYTCMRYFNVCGSDREGLIGEDHTPETHLIPVVIEAALGRRGSVAIFGTDYPTPDGTCIRDYVHVEDLAEAHIAAMNAIKPGTASAYNLGIGRGYSVRQIIEVVREVSGRQFRVIEEPRRAGDPPAVFADPSKIARELGWRAKITDLKEIVASAYRWMEAHPKGYAS
jgi:UDP-glucose-4-epimerase GalE